MKGFVPRGGADKPATEFQKRIGALITETQVSGAVAERKYYLCENAAPAARAVCSSCATWCRAK